MAEELLAAAHKYELHQLVKACEHALMSSLDSDNVGRRLLLSEVYGCSGLKRTWMDLVFENPEVLEMEAWKTTAGKKELLSQVFERAVVKYEPLAKKKRRVL